MNISELSLKRPILATVMNILIVLFGIVGYSFLAVREYPAVDPPVVNVRTSYSGANSEIIESQITEPLEKAINGIPGIRSISSSSSNGNSNITVEFNVSEDLEAAANDVRDKVSQAVRNLPQDVDAPPVVSKSDANSDFIIMLAVQSQTKGLLELSEYAENVLQERFQTISEVSAVNIFGQKRPSMRIWIDPDKLNSFNVTFSDIRTALNTENVEIPSGKIYGDKTELTIATLGFAQEKKPQEKAPEQPKDTTIAVTLNINQFRALLFAIDQNIDSKKASKELIDFLQQNARMVNPTTDWNKKAQEAQKAVDKN